MSGSSITSRAVTAALLGAASAQLSAATPPVPSTATVTVIRPLSLTKVADLDFGWIAVTAAGTITLNPLDGTLATTGGITPIGGTPRAARFVGAASGGPVVNVKIPRQPITLRRVSGTETLTLVNMTLDGSDKRTMASDSSFQFKVGGQLNVAAGQAAGIYVGTFTVTAQYP